MKTTFVFIVGMLLGAMTSGIGIHSLFGFFIAGIIIGEAKHFSQNDRHVMNRLVHSVFVPVFFANIGLHLDIVKSFDWKLVVFFTLIGICVRYCGAYLGSIFAKQNRLNRSTIAICHTAGGEMHIVVALLAFSSGLITHSIFVGIVAASILSTVVFGPWLAYNLKKKRQSLLHVVFQPEAILLNQNFPDKPSLMTAVSDLVSARIGISPENIYQEIQTREEQMSTAMGKGLAFPHARLKNLTQPLIYLIRNGIGLEWDSPDAKPVQLIFFILTPDDNPTIQLYILQTLAKALSDNTIREILDKSDRQEEIWARLKPEIESCEKCFVNV
jgi:mannitol/fructose-specific phosphotransferase system IIA component (Ntr-type)